MQAIRISFNAGPFDERSLFAKILKSTMTADQAAIYERERGLPSRN